MNVEEKRNKSAWPLELVWFLTMISATIGLLLSGYLRIFSGLGPLPQYDDPIIVCVSVMLIVLTVLLGLCMYLYRNQEGELPTAWKGLYWLVFLLSIPLATAVAVVLFSVYFITTTLLLKYPLLFALLGLLFFIPILLIASATVSEYDDRKWIYGVGVFYGIIGFAAIVTIYLV